MVTPDSAIHPAPADCAKAIALGASPVIYCPGCDDQTCQNYSIGNPLRAEGQKLIGVQEADSNLGALFTSL